MLIFDEEKQYYNLLENGFEKYPNKRDLTILAKHWIDDGISLDEIKNKIIEFCKTNNKLFNYAKSEPLILNVLNEINNEKQKVFVFCENISIFKSELDSVLRLNSIELQKILFIIICLAKWRNSNYIYINSGSSIKIKDIFNLANIKATGKEQLNYLHQLNKLGLIDIQLKPILKVFVPCIACDDKDDVAITFKINDNMINNFLLLILPACENCGNPFQKQCNKQKYCKECAKKIKNEQNKSYLRLGK